MIPKSFLFFRNLRNRCIFKILRCIYKKNYYATTDFVETFPGRFYSALADLPGIDLATHVCMIIYSENLSNKPSSCAPLRSTEWSISNELCFRG